MKQFLNDRTANLQQGAIRAMFDRIYGRDNIINLGVGEPDFYTPIEIIEADYVALKKGFTHYPPNAGHLDLRDAVSRAPITDILHYDPASEIIITAGAMGALSLIFLGTLVPGDEVIVPDPTWLNYYGLITLPGGVPVSVPTYSENGFKMKAKEIEEYITDRTKIIIVNNPSNPTGAVLDEEDLIGIAEIAKKHDLLVVSDEVYNMLIYDNLRITTIAAIDGMRERTVVVNSFSKTFAMTGWRVGYAMGPAIIIGQIAKILENLYTGVTSSGQQAAKFALSRLDLVDDMRRTYQRKRNILYEGLSEIRGFSLNKPLGALYAFPDISALGISEDEFCLDLLEKKGVVCIPGGAFGSCGKGHIRLSFANSIENLNRALEKIYAYVESSY